MFDAAPGSALLQIMRHYGPQIDDGRSLADSLRYAARELAELADEIELQAQGKAPGPDGIVGEAIDVMVCMADIIVRAEPEFTDRDLTRRFNQKCRKWLGKFLPDAASVRDGTWLVGTSLHGPVEILLVRTQEPDRTLISVRYPRTGHVQTSKVGPYDALRATFEQQGYRRQAGRPPLAMREPLNHALRHAA